ncbi:CXXC-type zinc finger protein 1-like [Armigeres subalbatus]|uniref:CXXC-type zinc finger protein 1-like n=1 Tax=Armigeres subalbatus TaxID=124917 RepID=UPI002ED4F3A0
MNETTVSYDCGACDRPNSAEAKMVECESCETWFHLSCAGVSPGVEKRSWICANCTPLMPVASAATKLKTKEAALQVGAKKGSRKLSVKSDAGITVSGGKQLEVPEQTAGKPTTGAIPKATKVSEQSDRVSDAGITVTGCQKLEVPERTAGKTTTGTIPKATKASDRVKNGKATEDLLKPAEEASTPKYRQQRVPVH